MSYLALYRRYRPKSFDKLIGQDHIVKILTSQILNDRLGHAYLFTGTRGTGKTSTAKIFAKAVNCTSPINGSPCHKCASCLALDDPSSIDVLEIDAASNNGVNEIRDLREKVQYPPVNCKYKVYIIDEVHMLSGPAFNALLKTLEEPPKHAIFILATTEVHKIPATILSRCMRFDFKLVPTEKIVELISNIYDELNKKYTKEAVFAIAKAGEGSIRDALSIADTALSYSQGELTYSDVTEILGSIGTETLYAFIKSILESKTGEVLNHINELSKLGKSVGVLTKDVIKALRDLLICKTCKNANDILNLPETIFNELSSIASLTGQDRILRVLEIFAETENNLKYTPSERVLFETAAVKATKPSTDYNIDALLSRITLLEEKINSGNITVSSNTSVIKTVEPNKEKPVSVKPEEKPLTFKDADITQVQGKLLSYLRKAGNEMLWNVLQNVKFSKTQTVLTLFPLNAEDETIINSPQNVEKIKEALSAFNPFELEIKEYAEKNKGSEIDDATEKLKKIFGDDIVIIKK